MKKIIFFIIVFFVSSVHASRDDCGCNGVWADASGYPQTGVYDADTVEEAYGYHDGDNACGGNLYWEMSFGEPYTHPSSGANVVNITTMRWNCIPCELPDIPAPVIDASESIIVATKSSCSQNNDAPDQQCSDANGTWIDGGRTDCCSVSLCTVPAPPPPPQCPPSMEPDDIGSGCHCPPDTFPISVTPSVGEPYLVCMPNNDCDPEKGQVLTPDGCLCPPGQVPDDNGTCLPGGSPDNNDTNDSFPCPPGQFTCYGKCQLMGVPCTDPNAPGGGDGDTNNTDPCLYPMISTNGRPYQQQTTDQLYCQNSAETFGDGNYDYQQHPDCWFGYCYYNNKSHDNNNTPPSGGSGGDTNNTNTGGVTGDMNLSIDLSPVTGRLGKIDKSINDQGDRLSDKLSELNGNIRAGVGTLKSSIDNIPNTLNSMNDSLGNKLDKINDSIKNKSLLGSLGSKLSDIKNAINDKNLSVNIDLNETNGLLSEISGKLDFNGSSDFNFSIDGNDTSDRNLSVNDQYSKVIKETGTAFASTVLDSILGYDPSIIIPSPSGSCEPFVFSIPLTGKTYSIDIASHVNQLSKVSSILMFMAIFAAVVLILATV